MWPKVASQLQERMPITETDEDLRRCQAGDSKKADNPCRRPMVQQDEPAALRGFEEPGEGEKDLSVSPVESR